MTQLLGCLLEMLLFPFCKGGLSAAGIRGGGLSSIMRSTKIDFSLTLLYRYIKYIIKIKYFIKKL
jgi:hypothetical protein